MKNVYIVGFMGTGKTVVGKLLAQRFSKEFVEMDQMIEAKEGMSIVDIFAEKGESYFRRLETEVLKEISLKQGSIVSCGGGLVCNEENLTLLKKAGVVFCLKASSATIYQRIKKHGHRPLLNVEDPLKKIEELLAKRACYYNKADYSIDTEGIEPPEVVSRIATILSNG
ncbi:MAG: shikimate kinase [Candidatus Omnitrophota bacterium]